MKKHEADRLIAVIKELATEDKAAPSKADGDRPNKTAFVPDADPSARANLNADQVERLYQEFKRRIIDDCANDPILLHLLTTRPEIILELEPRTVTLDGDSLRGRLAGLVAAGFFDAARRTGEARTELGRTGSDPNGGQLSTLLGEFVTSGFLTREGDRYKRAPDLKITKKQLETTT